MSTEYYCLKPPLTSLRLEEGEGHDRITVWERGACAGTLTLSSGAGSVVAGLFFYDSPCIVRTSSGLEEDRFPDFWHFSDTATLRDECGRLTTAGALRKGEAP